MTTRRDLRFLTAVGTIASLGVALIVIGVTALTHGTAEALPVKAQSGLIGGVIGGVIFTGIALYELLRRWQRGPQPEGRHAKQPPPPGAR